MSPVPARRPVGVLPILIAVITGLFFLALVANVVDRLDLFGPKEIRHGLGEQVVIGGVAFTLSDPQWLEPSADMLTYYRENNYYAGEEGDPLFLTLAVEAAVQQVLKEGYRTADIFSGGCQKACQLPHCIENRHLGGHTKSLTAKRQ